jgi:hypothetical protein
MTDGLSGHGVFVWQTVWRYYLDWRLPMRTRFSTPVVFVLTASVLAAQTPRTSLLGIERTKQQFIRVSAGNGPVLLRGDVGGTGSRATVKDCAV